MTRRRDETSPRSRSVDHRRPARLTIDVVEGRGIWVELDGCLIDGSVDQVMTRLGRLAQLDFEVVVLGTHGIQELDEAGTRLVAGFVDRVVGRNASVLIVDPNGCTRAAADRFVGATITSVPPDGAWWIR